MSPGTGTIAVERNAPCRGDLRGDLATRQETTDPGLCALTELDLDRSDVRVSLDTLLEARHAESPLVVTTAEVTGSDLPDKIAATKMMCRHPAFSSVVEAVCERGTLVKCFNCRSTQRTKTHRGDVDDRRGPKRLLAAPAPAHHLLAGDGVLRVVVRLTWMRRVERKRPVFDDQIVRAQLHLVVGTEPEVCVLVFRRRVDPPSLIPAERALFVVVGDNVLSEFGTDRLQDVAKMTDDRKVAQDGVSTLGEVVGHNRHNDYEQSPEPEHMFLLVW